MSDDHKKHVDEVSGVETTGHEWDGIRELNNPAPRWWLWVFYICCLWSLWYFVVYPAWPVIGGATKGTQGYTQYKELEESQKEILARQSVHLEKFQKASFSEIMNDQALYDFALSGGKAAFKNNCAVCHGSGAAGGKGYPNLNDDDWLWGGTVEDIYHTLKYGIRSNHEETRSSQMPSFGRDGILEPSEINAVVDYVLSLSSGQKTATYQSGSEIFQANCASCHGTDAKGGRDFGAPNLSDAIWLYGGDREAVYNSVYNAHAGVMPAWVERLSDNTIRQLAIYVHELGGGEKSGDPVVQKTDSVPVVESGSIIQDKKEEGVSHDQPDAGDKTGE